MSENVDEALLHQYKHETSHSATENHEMTSYPQLFPNWHFRPVNQNIFKKGLDEPDLNIFSSVHVAMYGILTVLPLLIWN